MFEQDKVGEQFTIPELVTEQGFRAHTRNLFKRQGIRTGRPDEIDKYNLNHAALGIAGESGEVVDLLKKYIIYGKELERDKLVEELGDLLFYLDALVDDIGSSWDEIREKNYNKLSTRYPEGYSDEAAIKRRDQE